MKTRNFIKILFLSTAIVSSGACSKHGSQAQQESERIDPPSQTRPESLHEQSLALSPPPAPPAPLEDLIDRFAPDYRDAVLESYLAGAPPNS